jgi:hypothetical protein
MKFEDEEFDRYWLVAQEDRCAPRTRVAIPAGLRASGGRSFQTVVRDLSISGFSASAITRIEAGSLCWLTLPGLGALPAEVIWWRGNTVGAAFAHLLSPIVLDNLLLRWRNMPVRQASGW